MINLLLTLTLRLDKISLTFKDFFFSWRFLTWRYRFMFCAAHTALSKTTFFEISIYGTNIIICKFACPRVTQM